MAKKTVSLDDVTNAQRRGGISQGAKIRKVAKFDAYQRYLHRSGVAHPRHRRLTQPIPLGGS